MDIFIAGTAYQMVEIRPCWNKSGQGVSSVIPGEEEALLSTREAPGHGGLPTATAGHPGGAAGHGTGAPPLPSPSHLHQEQMDRMKGAALYSPALITPCSCLPVANLDIMKPPKTRVLQLVLGPVSGA